VKLAAGARRVGRDPQRKMSMDNSLPMRRDFFLRLLCCSTHRRHTKSPALPPGFIVKLNYRRVF
jgi:hypothetical protein